MSTRFLRIVGALLLSLLAACGGGGGSAPSVLPAMTLTSASGFVVVNGAWSETLNVSGSRVTVARVGGSLVRTGNWAVDLSAAQVQALAAQAALIDATADADLPIVLADAGSDTLTIAGKGTFYNQQFIGGTQHSFSKKVADFVAALSKAAADAGVPARY
jgi:hypothetical protein